MFEISFRKLHLYPKGVSKVKGEYLSVFLWLQDHQNIPPGTKMHVEFKIRIDVETISSIKTEKLGKLITEYLLLGMI